MRAYRGIGISLTFVGLLLGIGGCASSTVGNQNLTADKVNQIQKGVTTRAQVEQLIGSPQNVSILGDGRRVMMYSGSQTKADMSSGLVHDMTIGLVPENSKTTMRRETLEVYLDGNDVVEDYEFSDNTTDQNKSVSLFGNNSQQTTTSNLPTTDK
jgi:outer membrane protein assembly factor BamE (lipoprotein component of BamABCDE complex)